MGLTQEEEEEGGLMPLEAEEDAVVVVVAAAEAVVRLLEAVKGNSRTSEWHRHPKWVEGSHVIRSPSIYVRTYEGRRTRL